MMSKPPSTQRIAVKLACNGERDRDLRCPGRRRDVVEPQRDGDQPVQLVHGRHGPDRHQLEWLGRSTLSNAKPGSSQWLST